MVSWIYEYKSFNNINSVTVIISRKQDTMAFITMSKKFQGAKLSVIVRNKPTTCFPRRLSAYRDGKCIPISKNILNPNNGFRYCSQFFEAVHAACSYTFPRSDILNRLVKILRIQELEHSEVRDIAKNKFPTREIELLADKKLISSDCCFAGKYFPRQQSREVFSPSQVEITSYCFIN